MQLVYFGFTGNNEERKPADQEKRHLTLFFLSHLLEQVQGSSTGFGARIVAAAKVDKPAPKKGWFASSEPAKTSKKPEPKKAAAPAKKAAAPAKKAAAPAKKAPAKK